MDQSKEIRWFSKTGYPGILNWFKNLGLELNQNDNVRTDFYLSFKQSEEIGIKLREGKVEIKHRTSKSDVTSLSPTASGYFEDWLKSGFNLDKEDKLSKSIIDQEDSRWIKIIKDRIGLKLSTTIPDKHTLYGTSYNLNMLGLKDTIAFGCQIEYTKLQSNNSEWFTFAFEWFGDSFLEVPPELIGELTGSTELRTEDSYGYPKFIQLNC